MGRQAGRCAWLREPPGRASPEDVCLVPGRSGARGNGWLRRSAEESVLLHGPPALGWQLLER